MWAELCFPAPDCSVCLSSQLRPIQEVHVCWCTATAVVVGSPSLLPPPSRKPSCLFWLVALLGLLLASHHTGPCVGGNHSDHGSKAPPIDPEAPPGFPKPPQGSRSPPRVPEANVFRLPVERCVLAEVKPPHLTFQLFPPSLCFFPFWRRRSRDLRAVATASC